MTKKNLELCIFLILGFLSVYINIILAFPITNIDFIAADDSIILTSIDNFIESNSFKDIFFIYGLFYLLSYLPSYLILGGDFYAYLLTIKVFLPFYSFILTYLISILAFKKFKTRLIFVLLALLLGASSNYASIRHLIPELALVFAFYSYNRKFFVISGGLLCLGLLFSTEYGVSSILALVLAIILFENINKQHLYFTKLGTLFFPIIIILLGFIFYLQITDSLNYYIKFNIDILSNFEKINPAGLAFLPDILSYRLNLKNIFHDLPSDLLFYFPFFIYFFSFLTLFKIKDSPKDFLFISCCIIYGIGIQIRTFNGPVLGYLFYGYIPCLLLLLKNYELKRYNRIFKIFFLLYFLYILFFINFFDLKSKSLKLLNIIKDSIQNNDKHSELSFSPDLNLYVPKVFHRNISELKNMLLVNNIISYEKSSMFLTHSKMSDVKIIQPISSKKLFVYPWGIYNNIFKINVYDKQSDSALYAGEIDNSYSSNLYKKISLFPPQYILINLYNNYGTVVRGGYRQNIYPQTFIPSFEDRKYLPSNKKDFYLNFAGFNNELKNFILQNYKVVDHVEYGILLIYSKSENILKSTYKEFVITEETFKHKYDFNILQKLDLNLKDIDDSNKSMPIKISNKQITQTNLKKEHNYRIDFKNVTGHMFKLTFKANLNFVERFFLRNKLNIYIGSGDKIIKTSHLLTASDREIYLPIFVDSFENRNLDFVEFEIENNFPYWKIKDLTLSNFRIYLVNN